MKSDIRNSVIQCVKEALNRETIDEETSLIDIGLDSMNFIRLIVMLEELFDIEIDDDDIELERFLTIDNIEALIANTLHANKLSDLEEE